MPIIMPTVRRRRHKLRNPRAMNVITRPEGNRTLMTRIAVRSVSRFLLPQGWSLPNDRCPRGILLSTELGLVKSQRPHHSASHSRIFAGHRLVEPNGLGFDGFIGPTRASAFDWPSGLWEGRTSKRPGNVFPRRNDH